ncbi:hypothetical protein [Anaerocolumna xylanovorans]|uniref:Lipoprotein n=1 Tax=Anaerocolumna xylanovorans DSM 12503 TaxID=1121345 RepID=A0A1M7XW15_9FIRM|nr:hypothetical protein [Anaerocolumna xylanovorans]SHO42898.1 hypothetical protein SAMN02745217_00018 [Anaerocolumna xylanovorans DSM 12503]
MKVFRKAVIMTMLLVFCGMVLAGCGKGEVKSPGNTLNDMPTDTPKDDTPTDTPADSSTDASEEVIKEGTVEKSGNVVLKQLAFVYKENAIAISDIADDEKIESMLGKADEIKVHTYSQDDGLNMDQLNGMTEKQYQFPGLVIKTIDGAEDKKSFIFNIEITDPKYPTIRNIKVGDSFEKLKEAYPEGNLLGGELSDEEDDFRYEPVNYVDVMTFHIKDKKIESIQIYTLLD